MQLLAENAVHPERAVIVVTHDNRVFHHADVIAHMDDGRIVETESQERGRNLKTSNANAGLHFPQAGSAHAIASTNSN
jgi:putative ABC transport system ATP-binding protein